ncbi:hypothetical protein DKX38_028609 [Salix brachista]|uniref:Uncharacterized protein n=1 Tax=Salix brachista TaxID=2182728 RepID=A0A5N5JB56_9ROSI|nr:hypothetical protein DKX38_028609 [Salix brachista]
MKEKKSSSAIFFTISFSCSTLFPFLLPPLSFWPLFKYKSLVLFRFCSKIFFEVDISAGAMRLLAVLVLALCLVIFGCMGSDAVPKAAFLSPVNGSNKKKSSPNLSSSSSLEAVSTVFSNSGKNKNRNITLDEMRVVPTEFVNAGRPHADLSPNNSNFQLCAVDSLCS